MNYNGLDLFVDTHSRIISIMIKHDEIITSIHRMKRSMKRKDFLYQRSSISSNRVSNTPLSSSDDTMDDDDDDDELDESSFPFCLPFELDSSGIIPCNSFLRLSPLCDFFFDVAGDFVAVECSLEDFCAFFNGICSVHVL